LKEKHTTSFVNLLTNPKWGRSPKIGHTRGEEDEKEEKRVLLESSAAVAFPNARSSFAGISSTQIVEIRAVQV